MKKCDEIEEVYICEECLEAFPLGERGEMAHHLDEKHNFDLSKEWKIIYYEADSFGSHSKVCHSEEKKNKFLDELEENENKWATDLKILYDWNEAKKHSITGYKIECPKCGTRRVTPIRKAYQCLHCGKEFIPKEPSEGELEPLYEHIVEERDIEGALEILMIKHNVEIEEVKEKALERIEEYREAIEYDIIRKDVLPRIVRGAFFLACKELGIFLRERPGKGYSEIYMTLDGVKPATPTEACRGYLEYFSLPEEEEEKVMEIAKKLEEHPILYTAKSRRVISGACIYLGSSDLPLKEITEKLNVTKVGIHNFRVTIEKIPGVKDDR